MTSPSREELLASEWLEADGLGGFASGTVAGIRTRRYHALLLSATTPADRPRGAGERPRGLARDRGRQLRAQQPALRPGRGPPGRSEPDRRVPRRALADLELPRRGRHRDQPGDRRLPRPRRGGGALAAPVAAGPGAPDGPPAALGPRLPRAAPREPGLRLRRRGHRRARAVAALSGPAGGLGDRRWQLPPRPGLVPQLPIRRRARARPRLRRGPGLARRLQLDPERPTRRP